MLFVCRCFRVCVCVCSLVTLYYDWADFLSVGFIFVNDVEGWDEEDFYSCGVIDDDITSLAVDEVDEA